MLKIRYIPEICLVEIDINNTTAGVIYDKISGAAAAAWVVPGAALQAI